MLEKRSEDMMLGLSLIVGMMVGLSGWFGVN